MSFTIEKRLPMDNILVSRLCRYSGQAPAAATKPEHRSAGNAVEWNDTVQCTVTVTNGGVTRL